MKLKKYLVITICLLFLLGIVGCKLETGNTAKDSDSQEVNQLAKQNQKSTSTYKTFDAPFLSFNYPSDWEEDREMFDQYTITSLANLKEIQSKEYSGQRIDLSVSRLNIPNVNNIQDYKNYFYKYKLSTIDYEMIDDKSYLNNDIAIIEYIDYTQSPFLRNKFYVWTNGDGKFYVISFLIDESNMDNESVKEIINEFEKSLRFK